MQFPNSPRTRETERRMLEWRRANPTAETSSYNRQYESVYNSLTTWSDVEDTPRDWSRELEEYYADTSTANIPSAYVESRPARPPRRPKHGRRVTKGAFGSRGKVGGR